MQDPGATKFESGDAIFDDLVFVATDIRRLSMYSMISNFFVLALNWVRFSKNCSKTATLVISLIWPRSRTISSTE